MNTCISIILIVIMLYAIAQYYSYKQKKLKYEYFKTINYYKNNITFLFSRYNIEFIELDKDGHGLRLNTSIDGYDSYEIYAIHSNLTAETNVGTHDLNVIITDVRDWEKIEKVIYSYIENDERYIDDLKQNNVLILNHRHDFDKVNKFLEKVKHHD